jgi:RHS repeat-associated protein
LQVPSGARVSSWKAGVCALLLVLAFFSLLPASVWAGADESGESSHPGRLLSVRPGFAVRRRQASAVAPLALSATASPAPPFTQCPAVGSDTSCGLLVNVTGAGISILEDPSQGPYDNVEDTLVGVLNQSGKSLERLSLVSDTDIFGFDGDGLCAYGVSGCPFGPSGYEGPRTIFGAISPDYTSGVVEFSPPLEPGESTYFSLEETLTSSSVVSGGPSLQEQGGAPNGSQYRTTCHSSRPVNCATGVFWHEFTDASIPGRGVPLKLTRTYSSIDAATVGLFGHGWSSSYEMALSVDSETGAATVHEESGSSVVFPPSGPGEFETPPRVLASLSENGDGTYSFVRYFDHVEYVFAADGRLLREVDRNGEATELTYSGGRLNAITDPSGRTLTLAYSGDHVTSVTDPMGRTTEYEYDGEGDLVATTDPLERKWSFTYDAAHRLVTMTDPRGGTATNNYDSEGRVVAQTDPMGRETTWGYEGDPTSPGGGTTRLTDPRGDVTVYTYRNLELASLTEGAGTSEAATTFYRYDPTTLGVTEIVDPDGYATSNDYDSRGNLLQTTDQDGRTIAYEYGPEDEVVAATDPRGTTTAYSYDANGNLLEKSTPLTETGEEAVTAYSYEAAPGEVTKVVDPNGNATELGYDSHGNRTSLTDADGRATTFEYDLDGERTGTVSPAGNVTGGDPAAHRTLYSFDAAGELTAETDPLGHKTEYGYDGNGNQTSVTDALGHATHRFFDGDDELVQVTRADGSVLEDEYDAAGNRIAQIDGAGNKSLYGYDALGRQTSVTDPDGNTTQFGYDEAGRRTSVVDPEGEVTEYSYDGVGQLIGIYYSDGTTPSVYQSYDEDGNRIYRYDGSGESIFSYDSLNRMTSSTDGSGATVSSEYDLDGRLTGITYPQGQHIGRAYDGAGKLTSITDWLGHTTQFAYDEDGNRTETVYPNGVHSTSTFDAAGRLDSIHDSAGGSTLASFDYARDPLGQVTNEQVGNGGSEAVGVAHNELNQLVKVGAEEYGYDASDNPTTFGTGRSQAFDPAGQLVSATGPAPEGPEEPSEEPEEPSPEEPSEEPGTPGGGSQRPPGSSPAGGRARPAPPAPRSTPSAVEAVVSAKKVRRGTLVAPLLPVLGKGDLLLAFVSVPGHGQKVGRISGEGRHWTPLQRADDRDGLTEIWQTRARGGAPGKVTVDLGPRARAGVVTVVAFKPGTAVLKHAATRGLASDPTSSLRGSSGASLWAAGHSSGQPRPPRAVADQHLVAQVFNRRSGSAGWVQALEPGALEAAATQTKARRWALAAVAVGPGRGATASGADGLAADAGASTEASASTRSTAPRAALTSFAPDGTITRQFTYNQRGNRTSEQVEGSPAVVFTYDQSNRLVGIDGDVSYAYDGDGLRVEKDVAGVVTHFVWNQTEAVPELLQEGETSYVYGPGGEAIEQITGSTPTYLHQDQQGSTRLLTNATGGVVGRYDYTPWGAVSSHNGAATTNLQFDGEYTDAETGFQYLRARYYDPSTGQFLSRDPLYEFTRTPFTFGLNDPVDLMDPTGMWCISKNADGSCWGHSVFHKVAIGAGVVGLSVGVAALTVGTAGLGTAAVVGIVGVGVVGAGAGCVEEPGFTFGCAVGIVTSVGDIGFAVKPVAEGISGGYDVLMNSLGLSASFAGGGERGGVGGARGGSCAIPTPYPQSTISGYQLQPAIGGFQ